MDAGRLDARRLLKGIGRAPSPCALCNSCEFVHGSCARGVAVGGAAPIEGWPSARRAVVSTLGVPGQAMHAKCVDALQRVSSACQAAGIPWGALSRDPHHAAKCRELGCRLFSLASDMDIVHRGLQATQQLFADFYN